MIGWPTALLNWPPVEQTVAGQLRASWPSVEQIVEGQLRATWIFAMQIRTLIEHLGKMYNGPKRPRLDWCFTTQREYFQRLGDNVTLFCTIQKVKGYQIEWRTLVNKTNVLYFSDTTINPHLPDEIKNRLMIVGNFDLQISDIQSEDEKKYDCASNINGSLKQHFAIISIVKLEELCQSQDHKQNQRETSPYSDVSSEDDSESSNSDIELDEQEQPKVHSHTPSTHTCTSNTKNDIMSVIEDMKRLHGIWSQMSVPNRMNDVKLQKIQNLLGKAACPMLYLMDLFLSKLQTNDGLSREEVQSATQLCKDAYQMTQVTYADITFRRRALIQAEIQPKYKALCKDDVPVTDFLFGK
ncbi:unnamed protein product [Mytilus coruscus]|uniref:Ig-like domain-containing protein n=1 Tax=Mytilus coruscus TaxID=42192 RepID=A0A6J8B8W8_MYTCO|nr:unnamed protein product [Mytilus coruscus]